MTFHLVGLSQKDPHVAIEIAAYRNGEIWGVDIDSYMDVCIGNKIERAHFRDIEIDTLPEEIDTLRLYVY